MSVCECVCVCVKESSFSFGSKVGFAHRFTLKERERMRQVECRRWYKLTLGLERCTAREDEDGRR